MEIFERLSLFREYFKESKSQFSKRLDLSQSTYTNYEKGVRAIPDDLKANLAQFGLSMDWLITGKGSMFSSPQSLGQRLTLVREKTGFDKDTFSGFINMSEEELEQAENDKLTLNDKHIRGLENNFGVNINYLYTGNGKIFDKENMFQITDKSDLQEFKDEFSNIYELWEESKHQPNTQGCELCTTIHHLSPDRVFKVKGYAEGLLHEQTMEEDHKANSNAG